MLKELSKDNNKFVFIKDTDNGSNEEVNGLEYSYLEGNEYLVPYKTYIKISHPSVGLGVFAKEDINQGEIIEILPLVQLGWRAMYQRDPQIIRYAFANKTCSCRDCKEHGHNYFFMLGNGSIYNHDDSPNTIQTFDFQKRTLKLEAKNFIKKDQEIFINYGPNYFDKRYHRKLNSNNVEIFSQETSSKETFENDKNKKSYLNIKENGIIKEIEDFISNEDSEYLIKEAEKNLYKMTVLGNQKPTDYRIADGTWLSNKDSKALEIRKKISDVVNMPIENMEGTHIVKYEIGGEYKTHHDFFHENTSYYKENIIKGGQRVLTALIYLNDDFEGGETEFPKINKTIQPKKNKLVIWKNVKENGDLDHDSLHAGLPVKKGTKYICIIWIREKPFAQIHRRSQ